MKCFLWHSWGQWGPPFVFAYDAYQNRMCLKCGIRQQRKYGWFDEPVAYVRAEEKLRYLRSKK